MKPLSRLRGRTNFFRRPLEDRRKSSLGSAALIVLTLVLGIVVAINSWGPGDRRIEAEFAQAAGIRANDSVTVAGVPVGSVTGTRLAGDRVVVSMRIHNDVRLGADTRAAIKLTTLLGARYIALEPAGHDELPQHRIPLAHTGVPYDLQQALQDAAVSFDQVDVSLLARSLDSLAGQLQGVPSVLPGMLHNIQTLASILGAHRSQLTSLLTGVRQLTTVVGQQRSALADIVEQGSDLLQQIVARRDAIQALMGATTQLVAQLHSLVTENRPEIDRLLTGLNGLLGSLAEHDDLVRNFLQILPVPVRNFTNATGTSNELDVTDSAGPLIDSWMCALSGRADQLQLPQYLGDCK